MCVTSSSVLHTMLSQRYLLVKEAAWSRVPLQDDVVSFGLGEEISHLQSCRSSSKHTVIIVAGAIVVMLAVQRTSDTANQDEKDKTRKTQIHNLLDVKQHGKSYDTE